MRTPPPLPPQPSNQAAVCFIHRGRVEWHRRAMTAALALSGVFLLSYVAYHLTNDPVRYAGDGLLRVYLPVSSPPASGLQGIIPIP